VFPMEVGVSEIGVGGDRIFVGILHDITKRKQADEEIRELNASLERRVAERTAESQQLAAIIDASTDLVAIKAPDGRILRLNRAYREVVGGLESHKHLASSLTAFHPHGSADRILHEGFPAAERDGHWHGETEVLAADGR